MKESFLEKRFVEIFNDKERYIQYKCTMRNFPDRVIFCPQGKVYFVELKRFGERPRPAQKNIHSILGKLGFDVRVIDNVDDLIELERNL